jgi:hypothetical protein
VLLPAIYYATLYYMALFFPLLCTLYFAVLTWTLHSLLSTPEPTPRPWLFGTAGATALLLVLHAKFDATLGVISGPVPKDKFFMLLQFSGMLVVMQVANPWLRRAFTSRLNQQGGRLYQQESTVILGEKLLAVNSFLVNKAFYVLIYLFQVLAIWVPGVL